MRQVYEDLATIVKTASSDLGLAVKTIDVLSSTDLNTRQLAGFVVETCEDLLGTYPWSSTIGSDPWVSTANGFTYKLVNDTDKPLMDYRTIVLGTKWRFLNSKGLEFSGPLAQYSGKKNKWAFDYNRRRSLDLNAV